MGLFGGWLGERVDAAANGISKAIGADSSNGLIGSVGKSVAEVPALNAIATTVASIYGGPGGGAAMQAALTRALGGDYGDMARNAAIAYVMGKVGNAASKAAGGGALGNAARGAAQGSIKSAIKGGNVLDGALQGGANSFLDYGIDKIGYAAGSAAGGGTLGDLASGASKGALRAAARGGNVLDGAFKGTVNAGLGAAEKGLLNSFDRPAYQDVGSSEPFPVTDTYQLEPTAKGNAMFDTEGESQARDWMANQSGGIDYDSILGLSDQSYLGGGSGSSGVSYDDILGMADNSFQGGGGGDGDIWRISLGGVGSGDADWVNTIKSAYSKVNDFVKQNKELTGIIAGGIGNMAKGSQAKDLLQMKLDADEARRKAYSDSIINQKPATGLINSNPLAGLKQKYGV